MKNDPTSKMPFFSERQIAPAIANAPARTADVDLPYDPNNKQAMEQYWANAIVTFPGHHPHQDPQLFKAMTEKTIADKMYVKNASAIAVLNADARHAALVAQLPAQLMVGDGQPADLVLLFAHSQQELETLLPQAKARLMEKGALWVAYLKGTSKNKAGINRDTIRAHAETLDLESVAIMSMNDDWSALRLKA